MPHTSYSIEPDSSIAPRREGRIIIEVEGEFTPRQAAALAAAILETAVKQGALRDA